MGGPRGEDLGLVVVLDAPVAAVVLAVAVVGSVRRLKVGAPTIKASGAATRLMAIAASGLLVLDVTAVRGGFPSDETISLEFPLHFHMFVVLQGGNSAVTNQFHYASGAGRLSLDIVAVGVLGNRVRGLLSDRLSDYAVFGLPVSSPCAGEIVAIVDDLVDNPPGPPDVRHPPGNHLLVRCDTDRQVVVLLAHLQAGSVNKRAGDRIALANSSRRLGTLATRVSPICTCRRHEKTWPKARRYFSPASS